MIRAGVGISAGLDGPAAVEQAASAALAGAGGADLAILFATPAYPVGVEPLLAAAVDVLGTSAVVGASAHGVLGAGIEYENRASVSILALTGIEAEPFLISDVRGDESQIGAEIASRIPGGPRCEDLIVVLPDPRLDTVALVSGLDSALRPAHVAGAGAADPFSNSPAQWVGREIEAESVAGVVLRGSGVRVGVTQSCRPTTGLLTVTRTRGNWVLELDGRPALDVYCEAALGPLAADLQRAAAFVLVALPSDPRSFAASRQLPGPPCRRICARGTRVRVARDRRARRPARPRHQRAPGCEVGLQTDDRRRAGRGPSVRALLQLLRARHFALRSPWPRGRILRQSVWRSADRRDVWVPRGRSDRAIPSIRTSNCSPTPGFWPSSTADFSARSFAVAILHDSICSN